MIYLKDGVIKGGGKNCYMRDSGFGYGALGQVFPSANLFSYFIESHLLSPLFL